MDSRVIALQGTARPTCGARRVGGRAVEARAFVALALRALQRGRGETKGRRADRIKVALCVAVNNERRGGERRRKKKDNNNKNAVRADIKIQSVISREKT